MENGNVTGVVENDGKLMNFVLGARVIIMIFTVFGNTLTIIAVSKFHNLRTTSNMFIVSLSAADLLLAVATPLCCFVRYTSQFTRDDVNRICCLACLIMNVTSQGASIFSLLMIVVDRYIAVFYSLRYSCIVSKSRTYFCIAATWVLVTSMIIATMLSHVRPIRACVLGEIYKYNRWFFGIIVGMGASIVLVNIILYSHIFYAARKHARAIHDQMAAVNPTPSYDVNQTRIAKTMVMILSAFILCWVPTLIMQVIKNKFGSSHGDWIIVVNQLSLLLLYSNSFMNPMIYCFKNKEFYRAFKFMLTKK